MQISKAERHSPMTALHARWWQFSLKDVFFGFAIAGAGLAAYIGVWTRADSGRDIPIQLLCGLLYGSGALIGAGLFIPFKKAGLGAILGFVLTCALLTILYS
jgi:hypothetical protein